MENNRGNRNIEGMAKRHRQPLTPEYCACRSEVCEPVSLAVSTDGLRIQNLGKNTTTERRIKHQSTHCERKVKELDFNIPSTNASKEYVACWALTPLARGGRAVQSIYSYSIKSKELYREKMKLNPFSPTAHLLGQADFICSIYDTTLYFQEENVTHFCLYPFNRQQCYNGSVLYLGLVLDEACIKSSIKGQGICKKAEEWQRRSNDKFNATPGTLPALLTVFDLILRKPCFVTAHIKPMLREKGRWNFLLGSELNILRAHNRLLKANYSQVLLSLASLSSYLQMSSWLLVHFK